MRACVHQMTYTLWRHQFVCIRCRQPSILLRHQLRAASFVSLEGLVDNEGSHVASALGDIGAAQKEFRRKGGSPSSKPSVRFVPQQNRPLPDPVDKNLQKLFVSKQSKDSGPSRGRFFRFSHARPQDESIVQDSEDSDPDALNRMLNEEKGPLKDFLQRCKDTIEAETRKSSADVFETLTDHTRLAGRDVFADILKRTCRSRSGDQPHHHFSPTTSEVIRLYRKHNVMNNRWHDILIIQIGAMLESVHDPVSAEVTREISDDAASIFEGLLDFWVICLEEHGFKQHTMGAGTNTLKILDKFKDSTAKSSPSYPLNPLPRRSFSITEDVNSANLSDHSEPHLSKLSNKRTNIIAASVIVTDKYFQLFREKSLPISKSTESAKLFLRFSEQFAKESNLDRHVFHELSRYLVEYGIPLHIVDKALAGCDVLQSKPRLECLLSSKGQATPFDKKTWDSHQVLLLVKNLNKAIHKLDTGLAIGLWNGFQTKPMGEDVTESLRDGVFGRFLYAFFLLRHPEVAVEVWNFMVTSDLVPKQKHWHAMLMGSASTKDLVSMQACWSQMHAAGIEPDVISWTTWIHGLITCGEWQLGIGALEELVRTWKKVPKPADSDNGEIHGLLPTVQPLNGAISALQAVNKSHIIPRIFNWAKLQRLPLDISTFNIMLRSAVRKNETKWIDQLLSEMKIHNCQPDIITFTTMLEGLLRQPNSSFHTQTPEAQQATILTLLNTLQQRGLDLTGHTYSTILSSLLAPKTLNTTAARAVLSHMVKNKVQSSPQVYTTLMRHYFDVTPPDLPAIDSLWRHIQRDRDIVDSHFFDVMIERYAHMGEVERMLQFSRQMREEGKTPSWVTLLAVLQALVQVRSSDLANEFVDDVLDRKHGLLRHGEGVQPHSKKQFWANVASLRERGWLRSKE